MFMQVIQGRTRDAEGLRRQFDRWGQELAPGARGYLGSTGGVTEEGNVVLIARFENEAAARANSDRAEQGAWWSETEKYFEDAVTFRNCPEVDVTLDGGSDDAGFVQVIQGRAGDRDKLRALEAKWMPQMTEMRPDVLGSVRGWDGDTFTEAIYFTTEAAARAGEQSMNEADNAAAEFAEYNSLVSDQTYTDLKDPWFRTP
jgi:hypothetical protein